MKLIKFLDQKGTSLVSEPLNQTILKKLVASEQSISDLSAELKQPTIKLWRRMQRLLTANLVELTRTEKIGNIEKKLYRATATSYVPQKFLEFKPKDANLQEAFEIYSEIQKKIITDVSRFNEVPKATYPIDFALYASMQAFAQICREPATQAKLIQLEEKLAIYKKQVEE
jgi:hypothetical protein